MKNNWSRLITNGLVLFLVQVIFVNNINFMGLFNPKVYCIFLLLFPRIIKPSYFMTIGLVYGFLIDIFSQTYGIGMASSVLICFLRPYIFRILSNRKDEDEMEIIGKFKDSNYLFRYIMIGILIFHLIYFMIEMGELYNPFYIIWKSILSSLLTGVMFVLYRAIFKPKDNKKSKKINYK